MSNVLEFERHDPHAVGEARCLGCRHIWVAVAPVDIKLSTTLECPQCSRDMGRFINEFRPGPDISVWTCNCGNDYLWVAREGVWCPNCGTWQTFSDGYGA